MAQVQPPTTSPRLEEAKADIERCPEWILKEWKQERKLREQAEEQLKALQASSNNSSDTETATALEKKRSYSASSSPSLSSSTGGIGMPAQAQVLLLRKLLQEREFVLNELTFAFPKVSSAPSIEQVQTVLEEVRNNIRRGLQEHDHQDELQSLGSLSLLATNLTTNERENVSSPRRRTQQQLHSSSNSAIQRPQHIKPLSQHLRLVLSVDSAASPKNKKQQGKKTASGHSSPPHPSSPSSSIIRPTSTSTTTKHKTTTKKSSHGDNLIASAAARRGGASPTFEEDRPRRSLDLIRPSAPESSRRGKQRASTLRPSRHGQEEEEEEERAKQNGGGGSKHNKRRSLMLGEKLEMEAIIASGGGSSGEEGGNSEESSRTRSPSRAPLKDLRSYSAIFSKKSRNAIPAPLPSKKYKPKKVAKAGLWQEMNDLSSNVKYFRDLEVSSLPKLIQELEAADSSQQQPHVVSFLCFAEVALPNAPRPVVKRVFQYLADQQHSHEASASLGTFDLEMALSTVGFAHCAAERERALFNRMALGQDDSGRDTQAASLLLSYDNFQQCLLLRFTYLFHVLRALLDEGEEEELFIHPPSKDFAGKVASAAFEATKKKSSEKMSCREWERIVANGKFEKHLQSHKETCAYIARYLFLLVSPSSCFSALTSSCVG
ncbi:hypothetical protein QOT17_017512 [Balamuthia mandrillaris]